MNNDVVTEILLHLPVQSLFKFRAVCKFWADVIDSRPFRELYIENDDNNKSGDTVFLQFSLSNGQFRVQHNQKSLISDESDHFKGLSGDQVRLHRPVKGLICIECTNPQVPIAICNPFLGQLKFLPLISNSMCTIKCCMVRVGFNEDFKVVQLLACRTHGGFHAHVYSGRTDSWVELSSSLVDFELFMYYYSVLNSGYKNNYFSEVSQNFEYRGSFVSLIEN